MKLYCGIFRLLLKLLIISAVIICFIWMLFRERTNVKQLPVQLDYSGMESVAPVINPKTKDYVSIAEKDILKTLVPYYSEGSESNMCSLNILDGASPVPYYPVTTVNWPEFSALFARLLQISAGGEWQPDNCLPRYLVALIIPYQNRKKNLWNFLLYMHPFLQRQNIHYKIYVIELASNHPFNRGLVLNAGFIEVMKDKSFPCVILHDVDSLPKYRNNIYACTTGLRLMVMSRNSSEAQQSKRAFAFDGGANAILSDNYRKMNGFSNRFCGWGKEDTDFKRRALRSGLTVVRYLGNVSHYRALPHRKQMKNPIRKQMLDEWEKFLHEGLNTTEYQVIQRVNESLCTRITIGLKSQSCNQL